MLKQIARPWVFKNNSLCLEENMKLQKRYDITNDVKVNFLIWGFDGCLKNILLFAIK